MLKNYFISALRNFRSNKLFTLINVLGLSIGISSALVIYLIVQFDLSYDRFEKDGDRLNRVVSEFSEMGTPGHTRGTQGPLVAAVSKELSGVEETMAFRYYNPEKLTVPDKDPDKPKKFKNQTNIIFADEHYFNLLPYSWLAGNIQTALKEPRQVVLSETRARLYFPSMSFESIIGKKIVYDDSIVTVVSGVVEALDKKGNTDFNFLEFISLPTILSSPNMREKYYWDSWNSTTSDQQLYVRLKNGVTQSSVEKGLKVLSEKYLGDDERKNHFTWTYLLQPLNDIHFNPKYGIFDGEIVSKTSINGLLLVAGFLLVLGCINFINLTTAQASQRAKEIGIRKTLGSSKIQLIGQFLQETFLITVFSMFLSLMMTPFLLKVFADFVPANLHFSLNSIMQRPDLILFLILIVLAVSLIAGFYPALVLSSSKPLHVLKNQAYADTAKTRNTWVRQTLTVSQFFIAQFFILSTLFVGKQIRFMLEKDMGFKKEAILSFGTPRTDTSYSRRLVLLHEINQIPEVSLTSLGTDVPSSNGTWSSGIKYVDGKKEMVNNVEMKYGDTNYLSLFHIALVAGRNILPSDTAKEFIINETYANVLGFRHPADALGKVLSVDDKKIPIVGVMKDFHSHPLNGEIRPLAYSYTGKDCHDLVIALRAGGTKDGEWKKAIAQMGKLYKSVYPGEDFNYSFLDESIAGFYKSEQAIDGLLKWATALTVFISCLGLLGLVIYTTNRRTKEIGIRKVLGASVAQIVTILSKDFIKLVCIAFVLMTPVAWWAMHKWVENFAFRTPISWWLFPLSGLAMIVIALVTLSIQTIRSAMANPVESLRAE